MDNETTNNSVGSITNGSNNNNKENNERTVVLRNPRNIIWAAKVLEKDNFSCESPLGGSRLIGKRI